MHAGEWDGPAVVALVDAADSPVRAARDRGAGGEPLALPSRGRQPAPGAGSVRRRVLDRRPDRHPATGQVERRARHGPRDAADASFRSPESASEARQPGAQAWPR